MLRERSLGSDPQRLTPFKRESASRAAAGCAERQLPDIPRTSPGSLRPTHRDFSEQQLSDFTPQVLRSLRPTNRDFL